MEKLTYFIENVIAPPLIRISETRYLQAVQKAFLSIMPILIFSSMMILAAALPIPGWNKVVGPIIGALWGGVNSTLGFLAVVLTVSLGYHLGSYYEINNRNIRPISTALLSFISFMIFFPMFGTADGVTVIATGNFGATGIFAAIFITIMSVEVYRILVERNITIKLPEGVPPMVMDAFTALIPSSAVLLVSWLLSYVFKIDIPAITNTLFTPLIAAGKGPLPQFLSFFLDRILWFTGIHGSNVVGSVMTPIWATMIAENMEAFKSGADVIPNLFTAEWTNYFVRISVLPIAILAAMSSVKRYQALGKLSIAPAIFNIAEPIMFGLPIVLNPILFVPWVFGFSFLWVWSYIFTAVIPLIPPIIMQVTWTIPSPISAYLATGGNIIAMLFSLLNYFILALIFYPFFKVLEKQEKTKELEEMQEVSE